MDLFISYSQADKSWAEKLLKVIEKHGFSAWVDSENLKAGQNWQDKIEHELNTAKAIVLIVGPRQPTDKIQQMTWRAALEESWTDSYKPLIPLLIKKAELPKFLIPWRSKALRIERNSPKDWAQAVDVLIQALESYVTPPPGYENSEGAADFDPSPYSSAAGDPEPPGLVSEFEDRLSYIEEAAPTLSESPDSPPSSKEDR
jgi:hypothetical protein